MISQWYVYTMKFYVAMKMNKLLEPFPIVENHLQRPVVTTLIYCPFLHLYPQCYIFLECGKDFHTQNERNFILIRPAIPTNFLPTGNILNYSDPYSDHRASLVAQLGTHVNPWLIHVNVWPKPLHYCKIMSLQQITINEKKTRL